MASDEPAGTPAPPPPAPPAAPRKAYRIKVAHADALKEQQHSGFYNIELATDGSDTVEAVKKLISEATQGAIPPDSILLRFGPNEKQIGRKYLGDPTVDESARTMGEYSALEWMDRFPDWYMLVKMLPPTPPAPGTAAKAAAAMSEGKKADEAVEEARREGSLAKIEALPAPWGPLDPVDFGLPVGGELPPPKMVHASDFS